MRKLTTHSGLWLRATVTLLFVWLGAAGASPAAPITVEFSGHLFSTGTLYPSTAGDVTPFTGFYTIDPDLLSPIVVLPLPDGQLYPLEPGGGHLEILVAGVTFQEELQSIVILNNSSGVYCGAPGCDLWAHTVSGPIGAIVPALVFVGSTTKLSSTDFFVNQELTGWVGDLFLQEIYDQDGISTLRESGTIDSLQVAAPEPAALPLLLAALPLLAGRRLRRPL